MTNGSDLTVIKKYSNGSISSADAQKELELESPDELFSKVCSLGYDLFHIDRNKAEKNG